MGDQWLWRWGIMVVRVGEAMSLPWGLMRELTPNALDRASGFTQGARRFSISALVPGTLCLPWGNWSMAADLFCAN